MKWIVCPGCDKARVVHPSARTCSAKCRNRVWRRAHGAVPRRLESCAWCGAPLLYLPQDRLPAFRSYCHRRCARQAWLVERAKRSMTCDRAVTIAIRALRRSRCPHHLAAAAALSELQRLVVSRDSNAPDILVRAAPAEVAYA